MTTLNSKKVISDTINDIFNLPFSHMEWNGKSWFPHSNLWDGRPNNYNPPHDPDYECCGDDEHQYANPENPECPPFDHHIVQNLNDLTHIFKNSGTHIFILKNPLTVINDAGSVNSDHRGSNHFGIYFDHLFIDRITIPPGSYPINTLADKLWRIKGNKCDNHYEMFFDTSPDNVSFDKLSGQWSITISVDHGS
jgi:hypothetical protein